MQTQWQWCLAPGPSPSFSPESPSPTQRCELCLKPGATVGCCLSSCLSNFHFMCARASYCIFQDDKKVFCQKHTDLLDGKVGQNCGAHSSFPTYLPVHSGTPMAPRPGLIASQCLLICFPRGL